MKTLINITGILIGLSLSVMLNSCTETITKEEHSEDITNLMESDEITRDSLEKLYIATIDEIDNNLDVIRNKEGVIILGPNSNVSENISKKDHILNNIRMINSLMEENRQKIAMLEKSLAYYKQDKTELVNSISEVKNRMSLQEQEINDLKNLLAQNDFTINELNRKLNEKTMLTELMIEENSLLEKDLNRVYFAIGTYKELKNRHLVKKEGGILGIGLVKTINKDNPDNSEFSELNKTETTIIELNGKKPKIITKHPLNSYTMNITGNNIAQLTIKDPESFWNFSKHLIVEVK